MIQYPQYQAYNISNFKHTICSSLSINYLLIKCLKFAIPLTTCHITTGSVLFSNSQLKRILYKTIHVKALNLQTKAYNISHFKRTISHFAYNTTDYQLENPILLLLVL